MRLLFSVFAVLFTTVVFAGFIGWLLDLTPWSVDGPVTTLPVAVAVVINIALVAAWGAWHSIAARSTFKRWLTRFVPEAMERSVYVLHSGLTLLALCLLWQPLAGEGGTLWHVEAGSVGYYLIIAGNLAGWAFMQWAILSMKPLAFWGLQPYEQMSLAKLGPYKLARHPIQTGIIIGVWVCPTMTVGHVLFATLMTAYSVIGALCFEEKDLESEFGEEYKKYRREYWAFLPLGRRR